MLKLKIPTRLLIVVRATLLVVLAFTIVLAACFGPRAQADQYDDQINALQGQNSTAQSLLGSLQSQASSYQNAIDILNSQISSLQSAMAINQSKQAQLEQQIASDEQQVTQEKQSLADDVKTMYVDGSMTTIEELATSKNLSDYIDQEEYRTAVQNNLDTTIKKIAALQADQQKQKDQLDIVVNSEQQQNNQLTSDQTQQQQLLAYDQGQQAAYNQQINSNQSKIASLRAEQIAANRALVNGGGGKVISSGSCGGSYPATAINGYGGQWGCNYPLDNTLDNWGMYNRECVSYTAWMVYETYGYMPYWGGNGNANQWPADARAAGIPTGSTPRVGSVAIYMGGSSDPFGHAMWVTAINGNMITVQQYNLYYDGNYYVTNISSSGLTYIYFGS